MALSGWRQEDNVATMLMGKLLRATVAKYARSYERAARRESNSLRHCLVGDMKVGSTLICKLLGAIV